MEMTKVKLLAASCFLFGGVAAAQQGANMPSADARLIKEVRHELVTLPYYGVFDDLAYRVDGNNVTLFWGRGAAHVEIRRGECGEAD